MKRLVTSILALGLVAAIGSASAQSSGYYNRNDGYRQPTVLQPSVDRYGNNYGAQYDYARVVRVDPVIESGYSGGYTGYGTGSQHCYSRQDGVYAGNGGYDDRNGYNGDDRYNNGYGNDGYRNDGYRNDSDYGNRGYGSSGSEAGRNVATVIGGVIGAAIGSKVGGGSARYATAAVGSMVGGMAGRQIYESNRRYNQPRAGTVTVCDPVPANGGYYPANDARVVAYDVTYEYAGRQYRTRTNYNPGNSIRVRVDVRPE